MMSFTSPDWDGNPKIRLLKICEINKIKKSVREVFALTKESKNVYQKNNNYNLNLNYGGG